MALSNFDNLYFPSSGFIQSLIIPLLSERVDTAHCRSVCSYQMSIHSETVKLVLTSTTALITTVSDTNPWADFCDAYPVRHNNDVDNPIT